MARERCEILLHKQPLTAAQKKKLADQGVIAIRTDDPAQFRLIDREVPSFGSNDLTWAFIDAIANAEYWNDHIGRKLVKNLAQIAGEQRKKRAEEGAS